jgi:hypothetical protein
MQAFIKSPVTRHLAILVATLMFVLGAAPRLDAAMINSMQSLDAKRVHDMDTIRQTLENRQVEARLSALGYSQEEITQRISRLSDDEIHYLASQMERVNAGSNALGSVLVVLCIILVVVLILQLSGKEVSIK